MVVINKFLKRAFDVIASMLLVILLLPIWIIVAIAIKCDSKGPVLFKQRRRTKNGRIFTMYKFRSMVIDAEKQQVGIFNYAGDPRVTKVGKFLRTTSLDELPQLFNVIKGDLSIVGPRPCVEYELGDFDTLNKKYKKRFEVRAGITGLAQIKGRNENSWEEKVEYDNEYIDLFIKKGILIDVKILLGTIGKVFGKKNICEEKLDSSLSDEESAKLAEEEIIRLAHLPDDESNESVEQNLNDKQTTDESADLIDAVEIEEDDKNNLDSEEKSEY
ncbi:MAG: sugar transferase [Clostridia bacterium]|nr:sugar transferase [Clostridia bacterium]MDE7328464.1 sugar transferase [Clostridia bacterium]